MTRQIEQAGTDAGRGAADPDRRGPAARPVPGSA
jgi:hypothetical protein